MFNLIIMDINEYYTNERYRKNKLPSIVRILLFVAIPSLFVLAYQRIINPVPSGATIIAILAIGIIVAVIARSFITSPQQFMQAIADRVRWAIMHLLAGWYTILNICRAFVTMIARAAFWFIALLIYLISPIDLLPDVLFRFTLGMELKQKAKEAIENSKIETSFPW